MWTDIGNTEVTKTSPPLHREQRVRTDAVIAAVPPSSSTPLVLRPHRAHMHPGSRFCPKGYFVPEVFQLEIG